MPVSPDRRRSYKLDAADLSVKKISKAEQAERREQLLLEIGELKKELNALSAKSDDEATGEERLALVRQKEKITLELNQKIALYTELSKGLIARILRKYFSFVDISEREELMQYGYQAFHAVVMNFDADRNVAFSTYAYSTLGLRMKRLIGGQMSKVPLPDHVRILLNRYWRVSENLSQVLKREPTFSEITVRAGFEENDLELLTLGLKSYQAVSLQEPIFGNEEMMAWEEIVASDETSVEEQVEQRQEQELRLKLISQLRELLTQLPALEQLVITAFCDYLSDPSAISLTADRYIRIRHPELRNVKETLDRALVKLRYGLKG